MNILAFAASSSQQSINKTLVTCAAGLLEGVEVEILDLNDYEMPIFSVDRERELGHPPAAQRFFDKIGAADALLISYAEHNGSYTAAWKNLFDWTSRIDRKVFQDKPVVLLATSPGPGGAGRVLSAAVSSAPHFGANVLASLSIPSFHDNFDLEANSLANPELERELYNAVITLMSVREATV
ncbi:NADPH-dependent oxidoreductase [Microbulbifer flavimaris]|uniref:NADPH-dependent oxidoreductase n=1 Tax=Microbulbifer flavimaris TaxID=1781068 RepID=A0ABX4HX13_9GAMM|nr:MULTISPECIES: NAD(P)H-dependent oxidoreductase [Microbulbifer]KUJ79220.1 NADPH-dependent FMN reductase [Microbulbifer sp. ZGT114]PCO04143.1 NADPH-dependent oxidoreductase [Microbulbifer flavimaris]